MTRVPESGPEIAAGSAQPILLLAALLDEMRPVARALQLAPTASPDRKGGSFFVFRLSPSEHEERPFLTVGARRGSPWITAVVAGPGPDRVVEALRIHAAADPPRMVIHLGFAGGLDPALGLASVVRAAAVKNEQGTMIALDRRIPRVLGPTEPSPPGPLLLTADRLAATPAQKRALFDRHRAAVVDMETFPAAEAAAELGLPLIAMRVVSDPAGAELPAAAGYWVRPDGRNDLSAVLGWLISHPTRLGVLLRLASASRAAGAALGQAVEKIIRDDGKAPPRESDGQTP